MRTFWGALARHWHEALFPKRLSAWMRLWAVPFLIVLTLIFYAGLVSHNALSYEWMVHECSMYFEALPDSHTVRAPRWQQ